MHPAGIRFISKGNHGSSEAAAETPYSITAVDLDDDDDDVEIVSAKTLDLSKGFGKR